MVNIWGFNFFWAFKKENKVRNNLLPINYLDHNIQVSGQFLML